MTLTLPGKPDSCWLHRYTPAGGRQHAGPCSGPQPQGHPRKDPDVERLQAAASATVSAGLGKKARSVTELLAA